MSVWRWNKQTLNLIASAFRPYRVYLLIMLPLMVCRTGLETLMAISLMPLFDQILGGQSTESAPGVIFEILVPIQTWIGFDDILFLSFFLLVMLAILTILIGLSLNYTHFYVISAFEKGRRDELFRKFLRVDWLYYLDQRAGHAINAMTVEVIRSRQWFDSAIRFTDAVLSALLYMIAAAYISPSYIIAAAITVVLIGLMMRPIFRKVRNYGTQLVMANQDFMQRLNEFVSGLKVVRGSNMEDIAQRLVDQKTTTLSRLMLRSGLLKNLPVAALQPATVIVVVGFVYLMRSFELIGISELAVVSLILLRTFQRLMGLQSVWVNLSENLASFSLIAKLPTQFEQHKELRPTGNVKQLDTLELRDLSFSYEKDIPALVGINLKIKRGEFIGIAGSSGAGKTTLVDLILSLIKPTSGSILVNGYPLQDINPRIWRSLIGYVPQETILFNDTVANNITLLREGISAEDIEWASRMANADEFIRAFPDGCDTIVGDRGAKLSGGQRQRLALARALVCRPQLLLLDEATSALDSVSEKKIQQAIEELRGQLTIIVVAHRLSTLMEADRIVVLDEGKIVEIGRPQDLAAGIGRFREMHALQAEQGLA